MRRRLFARPKEEDLPSDDMVACIRASACYAVSDGASACYAGGAWARIISRLYVENPGVGPAWLTAARHRFRARLQPDGSDWLAEIAFAQGSFATLLGFTVHADRLDGIALGDSVLFVQTRCDLHQIPPLTPADFAEDPVLLSSHAGRGAFADTEAAFAAARFSVAAPERGWAGCRMLAMTDALAAWVVAGDADDRLSFLAAVPHAPAFAALLADLIARTEMRQDDSTLLIIEP